MFQIRPERQEEFDIIGELNTAAFGGPNEARLIQGIRSSSNFVPELSLVAVEDEDGVIGHILFSVIAIETETGMVPTLGLAPMAVRPGHQNRGIGSALVVDGLRRCEELGFDHVFVLGHPSFYPRFGFVPSVTMGIAPPFPVRDEVFMVQELKAGSLAGITGKVKYPPAFDAV